MSAATSVPEAGRPRLGDAAGDGAMLDALLAHAPLGSAFLDAEFRLRRVSLALAEIIGVSQAEQIGHTPAEIWPATLAARAESAVRRALAGDLRPGVEPANGVVAGGEAAGLALAWYPALGADGSVSGITMIVLDDSDLPGSADTVRRMTERYNSLVQAGNQVVWVTGPAGDIAEDSPEWRWVTGQTPDEYLADGWLGALHRDDRERTERDWLACVQAGRVFESTYRVRTRTGSYRHFDVRAVPIERNGQIVEWIGASTDVTGQREADEMRGRLTEQLSAAALRTSRLQQATSLLAKELSVHGVVSVVTEVGQSAIGADRSAVAILDQDRLRLRVMSPDFGSEPEDQDVAHEVPLDVPGVMAAAIAARRPVVLDSPEGLRRQFEADGDVGPLLAGTDERAWVSLPLITSGAPLGALQFSFRGTRQITDEERVFLEALAGQCALALERAMMFEREHATAETLQRSLLPDNLPDVPGIALRARYQPVSVEVGGDWYDAFRLPDGKLAVAAGDVMGKGLAAAAGMGRVRNALRALALTDPRPAAVLAGLDRLFLATEMDEQVTTVCYLLVDPSTGDGVAGNAGHLPPLLLEAGRPPRLDQTEAGTPLGWASPRLQYPFRLPPGSTAVLYSDGLVENRKRGLDAGLEELVQVAAEAPQEVTDDPEALISFLVGRMLAGYEQDDDVTVLALRVPAVRGDVPGDGASRQG